jgi:leucyl/phenylalanyl-tRNA---protein transferase
VRAALADSLAKFPYPVRQTLLGTAYCLLPRRLPGLLPLLGVTLRDLVSRRDELPHPRNALDEPDGLLGIARLRGTADLIAGYRRGMFAFSHVGPLKWWAPRHRMVLFFERARVEKTVRRLLRNNKFQVTFDTAFDDVVRACAKPRPGATPLTWITPPVQALFARVHADGYAHSVEVWENGKLLGGAFGLAVGRVFFTESQFYIARDGSKVGFAVLNRHLQAWGFVCNDGKHATRFLADCGMVPVTRDEFCTITDKYGAGAGRPGAWAVEPALLDDKWQPAQDAGVRMSEVLPQGSQCPYSSEQLLGGNCPSTW